MNLTQEFVEDYRGISSDVIASTARTFQDNLYRWFDVLESDPISGPLISDLENTAEFENWYERQTQTVGSMIGSARIVWPAEKKERLGMQLSLFRGILMDGVDVGDFGVNFLGLNDLNLTTGEITNQYFRPFSEDLFRYLLRTFPDQKNISNRNAPGSDRTISFDHNSMAYQDAVDSLSDVKRAVEEKNDFPEDADSRSERLGELRAGLELLNAAKARVLALAVVVGSALLWFLKKFANEAIGKLVQVAIEKLAALLGHDWLDWL